MSIRLRTVCTDTLLFPQRRSKKQTKKDTQQKMKATRQISYDSPSGDGEVFQEGVGNVLESGERKKAHKL